MSRYIISPEDFYTSSNPDSLSISEVFYDTIQGEGDNAGAPAIFIRLRGCTLDCDFCDSKELWQDNGSRISIDDLVNKIRAVDNGRLIRQLSNLTTLLVITGGSPLLQQENVVKFFHRLRMYIPSIYIEVENEMVIEPNLDMVRYVTRWNNSPKHTVSKMTPRLKAIARRMVDLSGIFKFVISSEEDVKEAEKYIAEFKIPPYKVCLMPEGKTIEEITSKQQMVVEAAIRMNVNFSHRLHIILWNDKKGV